MCWVGGGGGEGRGVWAVLAVRLLISFEIFIKILIPRQGEKSMVDDWWWCGVGGGGGGIFLLCWC